MISKDNEMIMMFIDISFSKDDKIDGKQDVVINY